MALNPFKLEKLKIRVYGNRRRAGLPQKTFEVMFNPDSFSTNHVNEFQKLQGINTSGRLAKYAYSRSDSLSLKLIFDGTGVADFGIATVIGKGSKSVSAQVDEFLDLCFYMDGDIHEPKFLRIEWGDGILKKFDCRLSSVKINYKSFDKNGKSLRAELDTDFIEDLDATKRARAEGRNSPDVTHKRIVRSGDTLPLLTKEIYGSSEYYLQVARLNKLNDFRNLTPGQEIFFPPLEK